MKELAWAAYNNVPPGMEMGLEAVDYYDPPNFTYPFGAYICVTDIDADTGEAKIRRFYALDDCGTRINPMIIEGQIHGGLTEAFGIAMGQDIDYDEQGNVQGASFMDYFLPTAVETPRWETDYTETPSPHHPIGAKGVGESPNVGGVPLLQRRERCLRQVRRGAHANAPHRPAHLGVCEGVKVSQLERYEGAPLTLSLSRGGERGRLLDGRALLPLPWRERAGVRGI